MQLRRAGPARRQHVERRRSIKLASRTGEAIWVVRILDANYVVCTLSMEQSLRAAAAGRWEYGARDRAQWGRIVGGLGDRHTVDRGGAGGGEVVAGTSRSRRRAHPTSYTGQYLRSVL